MNKSLPVLFLLLILTTALQAQLCEPDQIYADSASGVYPPPFEPDLTPLGGITDCAIIGQPFDFVINFVIGDTIKFGPLAFPLDSIRVTQVTGLPEGLNYACNPSVCSFPRNSLNCANIFGTPTANNTPGAHDLAIIGEAFINGSPLPFALQFPDDDLAPGKYTIYVLSDDTEPCPATAVSEAYAGKMSMSVVPSPASDRITVDLTSTIFGNFELRVMDLLGRVVMQQSVVVEHGRQAFNLDSSLLPNGLHFVLLQNRFGYLSEKFVVRH